jgi:dTDP-4-amino-4,6-dideoxygalactose transaminase
MIELFKVSMAEDVADYILPVLKSGYVAQGPKVDELENKLWEILKTKTKPVTVNSGTTAIDLALDLSGVGYGDEVISTPMTCFATQIGAIHRGAKIRWADVDPLTGLIDPESVRSLITDKTKAIIAVNWAGRLPNYNALKSFGVPVIEDAAHCWGSLPENVERGDYICYSFQAIKFLTTSDGGIVVCPEDKERQARTLRWFGLDRDSNEDFRYRQNIKQAGYKYHMNDVSASIGLANLSLANAGLEKSRANAKELHARLSGLPHIVMPPFDENSSYWIFPILVNGPDRDGFIKYLAKNNIVGSPTHHRNDENDCVVHFKEKDLPNLEHFNRNQLNIPVGWWLTREDIDHIIKTITDWKE